MQAIQMMLLKQKKNRMCNSCVIDRRAFIIIYNIGTCSIKCQNDLILIGTTQRILVQSDNNSL